LRTLAFCEKQVTAEDNKWFNVKIMPYRTQENRIDGVVVTFTEITAYKELEVALRTAKTDLQDELEKTRKHLAKQTDLEGELTQAREDLSNESRRPKSK
ncbi:MAG: PAS domain-containing protein, partial [Candidatus Methylacidiphilales bacterium]